MNKRLLSTLLQTTRPPFLILAPICVSYGGALAFHQTGSFHSLYFCLAIIGGIASHISVNTFNEYFDFKSGLDFTTNKTPFSGGSNALPQNPEFAQSVLFLACSTLSLTILIGLYFVVQWGWAIAPLGILGCLIIFTYTKWLNQSAILCWFAPGLGFGLLMVLGTYFVLTGRYDIEVALASLIPFLLANNLLLLNQFPDELADRSIGRKHVVVTYGKPKALLLYTLTTLACMMVIVACIILNVLPLLTLIALIPLSLGILIAGQIKSHQYNMSECIPFLGANVAITLFTPILIASAVLLP